MDRLAFKLPFTRSNPPSWVCSRCRKGQLRFVEGHFHCEETKASKDYKTEREWDPGWAGSIYSGLMKCDNGMCGEAFATSGVGSVMVDYEEVDDAFPEEILFPELTSTT